jgi:hypothetical protein
MLSTRKTYTCAHIRPMQQFLEHKRLGGSREKNTMAMLQRFTSNLHASTVAARVEEAAGRRKEGDVPRYLDGTASVTAPPLPLPQLPCIGHVNIKFTLPSHPPQSLVIPLPLAPAPLAASASASDSGYDGKVNAAIDHRTYMPPAWRMDQYLEGDGEGEDDLASLKAHRWACIYVCVLGGISLSRFCWRVMPVFWILPLFMYTHGYAQT